MSIISQKKKSISACQGPGVRGQERVNQKNGWRTGDF